MTHPLLSAVPLYPRRVTFFCANSDPSRRGKTYKGSDCDGSAEFWLVAGRRAISKACKTCIDRDLPKLQELDHLLHLDEEWSAAPIYHDLGGDQTRPRDI